MSVNDLKAWVSDGSNEGAVGVLEVSFRTLALYHPVGKVKDCECEFKTRHHCRIARRHSGGAGGLIRRCSERDWADEARDSVPLQNKEGFDDCRG